MFRRTTYPGDRGGLGHPGTRAPAGSRQTSQTWPLASRLGDRGVARLTRSSARRALLSRDRRPLRRAWHARASIDPRVDAHRTPSRPERSRDDRSRPFSIAEAKPRPVGRAEHRCPVYRASSPAQCVRRRPTAPRVRGSIARVSRPSLAGRATARSAQCRSSPSRRAARSVVAEPVHRLRGALSAERGGFPGSRRAQ